MPIIKIEDSMQIEFGTGDIEVMPGLLEDNGSVGALCFMQKTEATPIGTHTDYLPYKKVEAEESEVRFVFHKTESIDVIIKSLQETKQYMIDQSLASKV